MKAAIIGYGKMGHAIEQILRERGHEVVAIVDEARNADGESCYAKVSDVDVSAIGVDVAFEFSTPGAALENIKMCIEAGVPVVCGTTAWTAHLPEVEALCKERGGAFFYSSNYSIGVNVVFEINRQLARMMNRFPEYDVTIEETHHTEKKDAPSGTAITMAEDIVAALERKTSWVGGTTTEPGELEVVSVRRSVAPGTHTVTYESPVDSITLTHNIKNRSGLAMGAVMAGEFLTSSVEAGEGGMFTMKDLLNL